MSLSLVRKPSTGSLDHSSVSPARTALRSLLRPVANFSITDAPDALAEYFGLGKTDTFNPRTAPHLTLYVWQVRGKAAAEVLERTVPYMVSDIRRDVEYILERTRPAQSYDGDVLVLFDRLESMYASSLRSETAV